MVGARTLEARAVARTALSPLAKFLWKINREPRRPRRGYPCRGGHDSPHGASLDQRTRDLAARPLFRSYASLARQPVLTRGIDSAELVKATPLRQRYVVRRVLIVVAAAAYVGTAWADSIIHVDCPQLGKERAAAFEARVRADLAVRGEQGSLTLHCERNASMVWRREGTTTARSAHLADEPPTVESLFEAYTRLVSSPVTPAPGTPTDTDGPSSTEEDGDGDGGPVSTPTAPEQGNTDATQKVNNDATNATPPGSSSAPEPGEAEQPTQSRSADAPPTGTSDTPPPDNQSDEPHDSFPSWGLGIGPSASLWQNDLALGLALGGWSSFTEGIGAQLDLFGAQSLSSPQGVSTRLLEGSLSLRWAPTPQIGVILGLGGALAEVRASDNLRLAEDVPNDCGLAGNGGWCPLIAAHVGAWWSPFGVDDWHPEVGAQLAWSRRSIAIDFEGRDGPISVLPSLRSSVIVRIAWSAR